jgi:hypothetical protein
MNSLNSREGWYGVSPLGSSEAGISQNDLECANLNEILSSFAH